MSFVPPPMSVPLELQLDFHSVNNSAHPFVTHPLANGDLKTYSYADIVPKIHQVAKFFQRQVTSDSRTSHVVAFIATPDALTSFMIIMGILRAGLTAFPISPRFSPEVVSRLLMEVKPAYIIAEEGYMPLKAISTISHGNGPILLDLPNEALELSSSQDTELMPLHHRASDEPAYIIHSSATSGPYPKTIRCSSDFMLRNAELIDYVRDDLRGKIVGMQSAEFFHFIGLAFLNWAVRAGFVMAFLNPQDQKSKFPAHPNFIFQGYVQTRPSLIYASPRLIETWATDSDKLPLLRSATINTAGKMLNKQVGDFLACNGVRINVGFGSTETGAICMMSDDQGMDWEYFYAPPVPEFKFIERPNFNGLYGLVVQSSNRRKLSVYNTSYNEVAAYDTGDLFMKHPTKPDHYKVIGRISDQIMLSTGEVINPLPIEEAISRQPEVKMAIVFGHGRITIGVIVQFHPEIAYGIDCTANDSTVTTNDILSRILHVNHLLPSSAHLTEKTIITASTSKPLLMSPKGLPWRIQALEDYEEEILAAYSTK
ncbi:hypothetical protein EV361DRAFT_211914 [Lentinula raphanica]|uniref:AMP-dependent synthetase/ligase domain-containing protein n=1 Tax=Lentinula raphanica TaxID=153919 RepID=A0AA38UB29_9AGAR|nr:hypothetical protein F5878DRAFT_278895 [Lentinula raphanica]KAJ3971551.1 hypothetical protein EV361DRAFT_211914 [Lentinula raphanica]